MAIVDKDTNGYIIETEILNNIIVIDNYCNRIHNFNNFNKLVAKWKPS